MTGRFRSVVKELTFTFLDSGEVSNDFRPASSTFAEFPAWATWMALRFDVHKCVCSTLRRMSGGIATPVPNQVKTLFFARFNYRFFMGVVYVINCRKGAHRSSKLSFVVSLKKLTFAMSIISFILWNILPESNIELIMDRFPEAISWSIGWEYQQMSWLSFTQ